MRKLLTSFVSTMTLLQLQLFYSVAAFSFETDRVTDSVKTIMSMNQKNLVLAASDFNKIKDRSLLGIQSHYDSTKDSKKIRGEIKKLSADLQKRAVPKMRITKETIVWEVDKDVVITMNGNDLMAGKITMNGTRVPLPRTTNPDEFHNQLKKTFEELKALNQSKSSSIFMNDAHAIIPLLAIFAGVNWGFIFQAVTLGMIGLISFMTYANASEPVTACINSGNCGCMNKKDMAREILRLQGVGNKLGLSDKGSAEMKNIDPDSADCPKRIEEILDPARTKNEKIDPTLFSKEACKHIAFAKKCFADKEIVDTLRGKGDSKLSEPIPSGKPSPSATFK